MGKELIRLNRRRSTESLIDRIVERPGDALIVHYSCESFYDRNDGRTPRVTSIAVRNFDSGQTESFSIHKVAEVRGIRLVRLLLNMMSWKSSCLPTFLSSCRRIKG